MMNKYNIIFKVTQGWGRRDFLGEGEDNNNFSFVIKVNTIFVNTVNVIKFRSLFFPVPLD